MSSFTFRYAVSVLWVLDSDYNVVKTWFGRTVIRSSYKLFYEVSKACLKSVSVLLRSSLLRISLERSVLFSFLTRVLSKIFVFLALNWNSI